MMRPVPSAIGNGASDKCERRQPVSSAGKIGSLCQTQEIWQSFLSAEKFVSSVNSERDCTVLVTCTGKRNSCQTREILLPAYSTGHFAVNVKVNSFKICALRVK